MASPESGHLASLRGFTKGWSPLSCSLGVLTNTQHTKKPQFIDGYHSQKNWLLALPCQRPPERNQEGERQDTCREQQCVSVFLSLFQPKRSANVTTTWTLRISPETLVCRWMGGWMDGTTPPLQRWGGIPSELSVRLTLSGHKGQWVPELCGFYAPQSIKDLFLRGATSFYIRVLCMSCRGEHILSLFIWFDGPPSSASTPSRPRFQL